MNRPRPRCGIFVAVLFVLGGLCGSAFAAETDASGSPLDMLFKLGLADSKGAKWVRVEGIPNSMVALPSSGEGSYSGNAWLIRQDRNGIVELIVNQCERLRAKTGDSSSGSEENDDLQPVQIQPANLEADVKNLSAAFREITPQADQSQTESAGTVLLFLAQISRHGHADLARKILPKVLALSASPEACLESAISRIADSRLSGLCNAWIQNHDASAYAKGVGTLCTEFSRGWRNRAAALRLAKLLRDQKASADAAEPDAREAFEVLSKLNSDQVFGASSSTTWLLEQFADSPEDNVSDLGDMEAAQGDPPIPNLDAGFEQMFNGVEETATEDENPGNHLAEPLKKYFERKRAAAMGLTLLLDDHRFLPIPNRVGDGSSGIDSNGEGDEAAQEEGAYARLPRPAEVGEIAAELLRPILPSALENLSTGGADEKTALLAWLKQIEPLDEEQLAWDYLKRSGTSETELFQAALRFLVERGGPQTQEKLSEVFLDPVVWSGFRDAISQTLPKFFARYAGDKAALSSKLMAVGKAALEATDDASIGNQENQEAENYRKKQAAAGVARLQQILQPAGLAEWIDKVTASKAGEETSNLPMLHAAIRTAERNEAERLLIRGAARAKDAVIRSELLTQIALAGSRPKKGQNRTAPAKLSEDELTRAALLELLGDETPINASSGPRIAPWTIGDVAANSVLQPRLEPSVMPAFLGLSAESRDIFRRWARSYSRALAAGTALPALPDPSKVPAGRVDALIKELGKLAPDAVLTSYRANSFDEQLAVSRRLQKLSPWPPALVIAQMTIVETLVAPGDDPATFERWKGKRFDAALRQELEEAVQKAARDGASMSLAVQTTGLLSGLILSEVKTTDSIPLPTIAQGDSPLFVPGDLPPKAIVFDVLIDRGSANDSPIGYVYPIWKDEEATVAWKKAHLESGPTAKKKTRSIVYIPGGDPVVDSTISFFADGSDPEGYEKRLRAFLEIKPDARGAFTLAWIAILVDKAENN